MIFNRCWLHNGFKESKIMESQKDFDMYWSFGWRRSPADLPELPELDPEIDVDANQVVESQEIDTDPLSPWEEMQAFEPGKRPRGRPRKVI
jgi:hypothetical protein